MQLQGALRSSTVNAHPSQQFLHPCTIQGPYQRSRYSSSTAVVPLSATPLRGNAAFPGPSGNRSSISRSKATELVALTEPVSRLDVDRELWEVLDLCSDEELETLYSILFGASPFSPVIKSIVKEDEPPLLQLRGRTSIMHKVCTCRISSSGPEWCNKFMV